MSYDIIYCCSAAAKTGNVSEIISSDVGMHLHDQFCGGIQISLVCRH